MKFVAYTLEFLPIRSICLLLFCLLLQGCNNLGAITNSVEEFNAAVKANPNLLNNQTIKGVRLNGTREDCEDGVHLENMVIRNLTLRDVQMNYAYLKNVTFVDCEFIKTDLDDSIFDNVKFIRGSIFGYDRPDNWNAYETSMDGVSITRVLFDGVKFGKSTSLSLYNGIVVMRNVQAEVPPEKNYWLLPGENLHVRLDNCRIANQTAVGVLGINSSLYATNSSFKDSKLDIPGKAAWIENCDWHDGDAPTTNTLVITNSRLSWVRIGAGTGNDGKEDEEQRVFLINNTYIQYPDPNTVTLGLLVSGGGRIRDKAHLYLYADSNIPGHTVAHSGNIHIYNAKIDSLLMGQGSSNCSLANLDLQNVSIGQGRWRNSNVRHGKWENVQIGGPVDLSQAKIGPIIGHNVTFPQGSPWVNGRLNIIDSLTPLEFDKPPVPTLEELGLAQFWRENDFPPEKY